MRGSFNYIFTVMLTISMVGCAGRATKAEGPEGAEGTFRGMLRTGMMAIGGESTGTMLTLDSGEVLELQFAPGTSGKMFRGARVEVDGRLTEITSPERGLRKIVQVSQIRQLP